MRMHPASAGVFPGCPAKDVLFYQAGCSGNLLSKERMAIIKQILEEGRGLPVVTTAIDALMDRIASPGKSTAV